MTRRRFSLVSRMFALLVISFPAPYSALAQDGSSSVPQVPQEYALGAEDALRIQVWSRPDLGGSFVVDASGYLALPLIGRVPCEGKTPTELETDLRSRFAIADPLITAVSVTVTQYNSRHITVVGEVRLPGRYPFREIPDLWQIILGAGGATPTADMSRVQIVRKNPEPGEQHTLRIDLSDDIENVDLSALPVLRPRDTVMIPTVTVSTASGSRVYILGAVRSPGVYSVGEAESVVEAIAASGGALSDANLSRVRLTRPGDGGAVVYELDIRRYLEDGRPSTDFRLRAGDTITVPGSGTVGSVLKEVIRYVPLVTSVTGLIFALGR